MKTHVGSLFLPSDRIIQPERLKQPSSMLRSKFWITPWREPTVEEFFSLTDEDVSEHAMDINTMSFLWLPALAFVEDD